MMQNLRPRLFITHLEFLKGEFESMSEEIDALRKERDEYREKVEAQAKELLDVRVNSDCERCKKGIANDLQSIASTREIANSLSSKPPSNTLGRPGTCTPRGVCRDGQSSRSTPCTALVQEPRQAQSSRIPTQSISTNAQFISLPSHPLALTVNPSSDPDERDSIIFSNEVSKELDVEMVHTLFHEKMVQCVKFSQDGKYLAAGCRDGKAYIYNVQTGTLTCVLRNLLAKEDCFDSVCFNCNGKYLATGAQDACIYIWEIKTKYVRNAFKGHTDLINTLDFSPNGGLLVSTSRDNTVRLWNLRYGAVKVWTDDNPSSLGHHYHTSAVFSPDGRYVASSHADGVLRIWDVRTGRLIRNVTAHLDWVYDVAFMPDGEGLVSGGSDRSLEYWDISSLAATQRRANSHGHTASVYSIAINPDGKWVASGSVDKSVRIWDTRNGEMQCILKDRQWIYSVDFSPAGSFLASGGEGGVVRIWRYSSTNTRLEE